MIRKALSDDRAFFLGLVFGLDYRGALFEAGERPEPREAFRDSLKPSMGVRAPKTVT